VLWAEIAPATAAAALAPMYLEGTCLRPGDVEFDQLTDSTRPVRIFPMKCTHWHGITAKAAACNLPEHRRCRLQCFFARAEIAGSVSPSRLCLNNFETTGGLLLRLRWPEITQLQARVNVGSPYLVLVLVLVKGESCGLSVEESDWLERYRYRVFRRRLTVTHFSRLP